MMQIDVLVESVKRKLLSEEKEEVNPESKRSRLFELSTKLFCDNQLDNSCLQFISNYSHVFQHLPLSSALDDALVKKIYLIGLSHDKLKFLYN